MEAPEPSFLYKINSSIVDGWDAVSAILLALVRVWPLLLVLGIGWGLWRRYRLNPVTNPAA